MIVVDLGCATVGGVDSLATLADEYRPDRIYGFDPSPHWDIDVECVNGVPVTLSRTAAWVYDGKVSYHDDSNCSYVGGPGDLVPCFDFSAWLREHGPAVVKVDIEGGEYPLLEQLLCDGTDSLVQELLVEWHGDGDRVGLLSRLRCPVREWWL